MVTAVVVFVAIAAATVAALATVVIVTVVAAVEAMAVAVAGADLILAGHNINCVGSVGMVDAAGVDKNSRQ